MTTGVFYLRDPRSGGGQYRKPPPPTSRSRRAASAARSAKRDRMIDQFADLLAEGQGVLQAGRTMGVSRQAAVGYFRTIRDRLGWQAV